MTDEKRRTADPCSCSESEAEDGRDDPDLGQLPLDGLACGLRVVVWEGSASVREEKKGVKRRTGDGDGGDVGKDGEEDDEVDANGLVLDEHVEEKEDLEVKAQGDTVDDVGTHAVEDLAGGLDGKDDGRKSLVEEDDVGGGLERRKVSLPDFEKGEDTTHLSSVGGSLDGDTAVGLLECRSVVDTVTSHGDEVTALHEHSAIQKTRKRSIRGRGRREEDWYVLYDLVLVLWEDFAARIRR